MFFEVFEVYARQVPSLSGPHVYLLYGLIRWLQPEVVVEVGCFHGGASVWMGRALVDNRHGALFCIDDFSLHAGVKEQFAGNVVGCQVGDVVALLEGKSSEVEWPERVDLAFIDGNHSQEGCEADVRRAMERGARCVIIHDTVSWWGPRGYVEKIRSERAREWDVLEVNFCEGLAVMIKREEKAGVTFSEEAYPEGRVIG